MRVRKAITRSMRAFTAGSLHKAYAAVDLCGLKERQTAKGFQVPVLVANQIRT